MDIQTATIRLFERRFKIKFRTVVAIIIAYDIVAFFLTISNSSDTTVPAMAWPWVLLGFTYGYLHKQARADFWCQFAQTQKLTYTAEGNPAAETAEMFRQGDNQIIRNYLTGVFKSRPLRIFEYTIVIQREKRAEKYPYTVFAFKFEGCFPHVYLNYKDDSYSVRFAEPLPLHDEFGDKFHAYAPRKYEIEALAILTPDVLNYLLEVDWACDIELIDSELIIFHPGLVTTTKELNTAFKQAKALVEKLAPALDKFRFEQIGDYSYRL